MLRKLAITDAEQFDELVKDAQSIVVYGTGILGKATVDHLIERGNRDKIAAIVHTRGLKNDPQNFRKIPIQEASVFFAQPERKDTLVIVSVGTPQYQDEIFEILENYGVKTCAYLHQMDAVELVLASVTGGAQRSALRSYIFTEGQLCDLVDNANEVVIYGTKECGDRLVNYLELTGRGSKIQENIRLIQETSGGKYSAPTSPSYPIAEDTLVLVAPDYPCVSTSCAGFPQGEIKGLDLKHYYFCTVELMEKLFVLLKSKAEGEVVQEIQFMFVGFPRCGTTSLHYALQEVEDIYLPDEKEAAFFHLKDDLNLSKEKWLRRFYSHVPKGSISGCIEPSFVPFAKEIREVWGPNLKVCFMVRNPVDATYSVFRMNNREGRNTFGSKSLEIRYDRYGKYCEEIFDDFITVLLEEKDLRFEYADAIEEYLRYYPLSQIKVIFFEELIRKPGEKINEILRFVGSKGVYDPQFGLPKENAGDFVWADQKDTWIGVKWWMILMEKFKDIYWRILDDPEAALANANELENRLFSLNRPIEAAEKIYHPKMTPEQRKRLEDFYRPSVRKLEKMLGKDLSKLWFE